MSDLRGRRRHTKRVGLTVAGLLALFLLAGCGGSDAPELGSASDGASLPAASIPVPGRADLLALGATSAEVWPEFRTLVEDWNARIADCDTLYTNRGRLVVVEVLARAQPIERDLNDLEAARIANRAQLDTLRDDIDAYRAAYPTADAPIVDLLRREGSADARAWADQVERAIEGRPEWAERFPCS